MAIPGELSVAIHDSHPQLGEMYEFAFYLPPPYTDHAFESKRDEMAKKWIEHQAKQGKVLKTRINVIGPHDFVHTERRILDPKWMGQHEFVLQAWFKREKPMIVRAGVIDLWHERRRRLGYDTVEPVGINNDLPQTGKRFELENDWADK